MFVPQPMPVYGGVPVMQDSKQGVSAMAMTMPMPMQMQPHFMAMPPQFPTPVPTPESRGWTLSASVPGKKAAKSTSLSSPLPSSQQYLAGSAVYQSHTEKMKLKAASAAPLPMNVSLPHSEQFISPQAMPLQQQFAVPPMPYQQQSSQPLHTPKPPSIPATSQQVQQVQSQPQSGVQSEAERLRKRQRNKQAGVAALKVGLGVLRIVNSALG